jgi:hypothetical protein
MTTKPMTARLRLTAATIDGAELEAADVPPKRRRLRRKADVGGAFVPIGVLALTMTPTTDDA